MKKYVLIILMVLVFTYTVEAEAMSKSKIEVDGGVAYNNYLYKKYDIKQGKKELDGSNSIKEDLNQGTGYYLEATYWLNKQFGVGLGMQKTKMEAQWESGIEPESYQYKSKLDIYYSSLNYRLNQTLKLYIDINYNIYQEHYFEEKFSTDIKSGTGFGIMLGTEVDYPINKNFDLLLNTGYYLADIDIDERYSSHQGKVINVDDELLRISGLGFKFGIDYRF